MGKFIVNCKYDLGSFWNDEMNSMLGAIRSIVHLSECDVEIKSIKRSGCDLIVDFSFPTKDVDVSKTFLDGQLIYAVEGIVSIYTNSLRVICPICGKDKGPPPSLTVRPGLCELCRSKIVPSDYKDNVIICMSGKAGSGKDTVADYLVNKHGFQRMAFADPLRDIVQLVFVLDHDSVWDRKLRELPLKNLPDNEKIDNYLFTISCNEIEDLKNLPDDYYWSVRKLLQFIGTEMFRNLINRDTWVMNFVQRLEPGINYVLTDCRFMNEYEWVKSKFGGKVIFTEVTRSGFDGKGVGIDNHESERYKLPADIILENNGTLEDLYNKIENSLVQK